MSRVDTAEDILDGIKEIATQDEQARQEEVTKIIKAVWAVFRDDVDSLVHVLPSILELSIHCPYSNVRTRFKGLLKDLQDAEARLPHPTDVRASSFTVSCGASTGAKLKSENEVKEAVFLVDYKVSNLMAVMAQNPEHAEAFHTTSREIFVCDGPLPLVERHYIAILAAAQHRCMYEYATHKEFFLGMGGDEAWLTGLENAPKKFSTLCELNGLLAFQPWRVTKDHIQALLQGESSWSLSELIQGIVVIVSVHAVSSFVYGTGVNLDIALEGGHSYDPPATQDEKHQNKDGGKGNEADMESALARAMWPVSDEPWEERILGKLKRSKEASDDHGHDEGTEAKNKINFKNSETESWDAATSKQAPSIWDRFIPCSAKIQHEDFDVSSKEYSIFRSQDYTWADHGFALLEQYHGKVASLLDQEFRVIRNMTDNAFGEETDVDTSKFRRAIWYYSQRIYGICHDDYDYSEVNNYLERPLKQFVKKLICAPELMTSMDFNNFGRQLACHEKIHIASLAWEARRAAALSYALHAIMKSMIN